jgi:hypothetical protein
MGKWATRMEKRPEPDPKAQGRRGAEGNKFLQSFKEKKEEEEEAKNSPFPVLSTTPSKPVASRNKYKLGS